MSFLPSGGRELWLLDNSEFELKPLWIIASKSATFSGISFSQEFANFMQQLPARVWQGNAKLLLRRLLLEQIFKVDLFLDWWVGGNTLGWECTSLGVV